MKLNTYSLLLIILFIYSCKQESHVAETSEESKLGEISFNVSGEEKAQPSFEKGLLLLHSFEYEDAREAFLEAQDLDPNFAMAYWGEAMTYNHSLWQRQEKEKAIEALGKLGATPEERMAKVKTPLEQDFFKAIEILYGEGTKYERDLAYSNFVKALTEKYPKHHEVSAFYAVSLLGASRNGRDEDLYGKSAEIAQGIIKENASHPGALHYLIHSFDDPGHAHLAKAAADRYSKVAPDAAHALHMPSHIYVALGEWNDVVTSNIASWNASVKRKERKELGTDALSFHALNWLQYGMLQRNEMKTAESLLNNMTRFSEELDSKVSRSYLVAMKGAHLVETNNWSSDIANIAISVADLPITKRAGYAFMEGMKAFAKKDRTLLKSIIKDLKTARQTAALSVGESGFAMCSSAGRANRPPSQLDVDMAKVMELELMAYAASLNQDFTTAAKHFESAAQLDEGLSYSYGPPVILKPVHEAYGEFLLLTNQPEKAVAVFEKALKRNPRRLRSLLGLQTAADRAGEKDLMAKAEADLSLSLEKRERGEIL